MVKSKKAAKNTISKYPFAIPAAPWIYIHDPSLTSYVTRDLIKLIPEHVLVSTFYQNSLGFQQDPPRRNNCVTVIRDTRAHGDSASKKDAIQIARASALKAGANFVSINVRDDLFQVSRRVDNAGLGTTNHLNITAASGAGEKIYKWLFTVFTICETLYLIPDAEMREIDIQLFPEYEYCTINDSRTAPKDTKIQFVALILTKPQVFEGKQLVWTVADKTGVAKFYFQHRGEGSQYTWDWVMNLKPGELKALPRMPMVQIKERRRVRIVKAPFRAVGAVIGGTGFVIKQVGKGISNAGKALKMGSSSEWVLEADVDANGKKIDWAQKESNEVKVGRPIVKKPVKVVDKKNQKVWDDAASDASTEAGTETYDEKCKEFV